MKVLQFQSKTKDDSPPRVGVIRDPQEKDIIILPWLKTTLELIENGPEELDKIKKYVESGRYTIIKREDACLQSPILKPDKVLCIGMNYKDHCEEQNMPLPKEPIVFNKFPSCIIGPFDGIPMPKNTQELDWEVELAVVIGKTCKDVSRADALDYVFGYTTSHDVSARDWQLKRNGGQWLVGKAMEGFCPLGPYLVTKDEIDDPNSLSISCSVNGELKQDSNTRELVFKIDDIVSWISKVFRLLPGDVILTGTPPGVGVFQKPPQFLKVGDVAECKISGIGSVVNTIVQG